MRQAFQNVPLHRKGCSIHEDIHKKGLSKDVLFFGYVRFSQQYGSLYHVCATGDSTCNVQRLHSRHPYRTVLLKVDQNSQLLGESNRVPYLPHFKKTIILEKPSILPCITNRHLKINKQSKPLTILVSDDSPTPPPIPLSLCLISIETTKLWNNVQVSFCDFKIVRYR